MDESAGEAAAIAMSAAQQREGGDAREAHPEGNTATLMMVMTMTRTTRTTMIMAMLMTMMMMMILMTMMMRMRRVDSCAQSRSTTLLIWSRQEPAISSSGNGSSCSSTM